MSQLSDILIIHPLKLQRLLHFHAKFQHPLIPLNQNFILKIIPVKDCKPPKQCRYFRVLVIVKVIVRCLVPQTLHKDPVEQQ